MKLAQRAYSNSPESNLLQTNDSREMWQQTSRIVPYKFKSKAITSDDPNLPNELNTFYSRLDRVVDRLDLSIVVDSPPSILSVTIRLHS